MNSKFRTTVICKKPKVSNVHFIMKKNAKYLVLGYLDETFQTPDRQGGLLA
jgi:hypothetical protein